MHKLSFSLSLIVALSFLSLVLSLSLSLSHSHSPCLTRRDSLLLTFSLSLLDLKISFQLNFATGISSNATIAHVDFSVD